MQFFKNSLLNPMFGIMICVIFLILVHLLFFFRANLVRESFAPIGAGGEPPMARFKFAFQIAPPRDAIWGHLLF